VLSPDPVAQFVACLAGDNGEVSVITVIEVPRSFLDEIRSDAWHPLTEGSPGWSNEEDAIIARYVEERGHRITEPLLNALRAAGVQATVQYLEGEDPADTIIAAAADMDAHLVILGATKHLFEEWESVSARVLRDISRPVLVIPTQPRPDPDEILG
jgi:nucleotide-binding universal stress UspA family protein